MAPTLRVTLLQTSLVWRDAAANRARFADMITGVSGATDLIVLPEMFTTGFSMKPDGLAEPADGPTLAWLQEQAARSGAAIAGSVMVSVDGGFRNRLYFVAPDGIAPEASVAHYDKRHLFRMAGEHERYGSGRSSLVVEWRGFRIAPLVCYDLRFPVWSRRRADFDYDLLLYVANWPAVRRDPWSLLLRARAVENLAYVVGVNRIGADGNDVAHSGDSAAHDFMGRPLAELGSRDAAVTVQLDRDALRAFREKFPAHLDADRFILEP